MINSLRALGYSFESALADIVDNSVAADADNIEILFPVADDAEPHLAVLDNGCGMTRDRLIESMRYASRGPDVERNEKDLGRFGLGMKTASFSQCRRLTVLSKTSEGLNGAVWDLNLVQKTHNWTLLILSPEECRNILYFQDLDRFASGTLVLWEELDRMKLGTAPIHALLETVHLGMEHLSLIFHRFISGEQGLNRIAIFANGTPLEPKDPFGASFRRGTSRMPEEFIVSREFPDKPIIVTGYTLPHQNRISEKERRQLGVQDGARTWGDDQGFYVYRGGRLIYWGGWLRLRQKAQLAKLCRVKVDVPNCMDHLWELDIKKSRATPPKPVRDRLSQLLEDLQKKSVVVQRGRANRTSVSEEGLLWTSSLVGKNLYKVSVNRENVLVKTLRARLDRDARAQFDALLGLLEVAYPSKWVNAQYLADATDVNAADASEGGLSRDAMKELLRNFVDAGEEGTRDMVLQALVGLPIFSGKSKETQELLQELISEGNHGH